MSQAIFPNIDPNNTSGNELAQILNDFKDAYRTGNTGVSRPTELAAGGFWIDTSDAVTNIWRFKIFDGTDDITVFTLDILNNTASLTSAESLFAINKISPDSVGPILRFIKKRVANAGQVLTGDTVAEIQFSGTNNAGATTLQGRIRSISIDNVTTLAIGSYMTFEVAAAGTSSVQELMRLIDGKVGIGTNAPTETLHVKGTGIRTERESDDAVGTKVILKKKRITGVGQVALNDVIGGVDFNSTDNVGAGMTVGQIEVSARELQTASAQGSKIVVRNKKIGSNTFTDQITIGEDVEIPVLRATTITVTNLVAANVEMGGVVNIDDASIVLNDGGTQALAQAAQAGIEVYMSDAPHAKFGYDSTKASKFVIGNVGSLKEVVDVSSPQTLSLKAIVLPAQLDAKQGLESDLITYANTASDGQFVWATDTQTMYNIIGNSLVPVGAGGGGGSSLNWIEDANAPMKETSFGFDVRSFDQESSQVLYALIPVPLSYRTGKPIKLVAGYFFSPVTTGNVFFKATTALVDIGYNFGTFPNVRASTNSPQPVSPGANNIVQLNDIDITDSLGRINGVNVDAGDMLRIELKRDIANETGSALGDAKLLIQSFQLSFS